MSVTWKTYIDPDDYFSLDIPSTWAVEIHSMTSRRTPQGWMPIRHTTFKDEVGIEVTITATPLPPKKAQDACSLESFYQALRNRTYDQYLWYALPDLDVQIHWSAPGYPPFHASAPYHPKDRLPSAPPVSGTQKQEYRSLIQQALATLVVRHAEVSPLQ